MTAETQPPEADKTLTDLVAALSLEEKVSLVSGGSAWSTVALASIGLREMVLSDGPSGVRGIYWDERYPSVSLPSATALSSSWDLDVAREYGVVVAAEARRVGVDVVLGPTVNLHRSPLGGRHFEAFSEDPLLTAELAAAYVDGVQAGGVAATVKHYVANDFETDRFNADVDVDERTLRELYLLAFEKAVTDAHAWLVMSAYNSVNGTTATENELLTHPLTDEWQFDGVVVSDWTAVRSLESARHPQDLSMPGPAGPWGEHLVGAIRDGSIDERLVDEKVRRILRLARRVGALDEPSRDPGASDGPAFARRAAAEGAVLVHNDGVLPLDAAHLKRVSVIGELARTPRIQGGGSATVVPQYTVGVVDGLRGALPTTVEVEWTHGAVVEDAFAPFTGDRMRNPVTGEPGAHLFHLAADGTELLAEERYSGLILDYDREELQGDRTSVVFVTDYLPAESGELELGFAGVGHGRLFIDDVIALEENLTESLDQVQGFFTPPTSVTAISVNEHVPVRLRYEFAPTSIVDGVTGSLAVTFGARPQRLVSDADLIRRAVDAAASADVAVIVVGTNTASEMEGIDRTDLRLPGHQDRLVSAVAAVNPRTVVVVNSGAPVEMPWREDVAAVLLGWFGGQEMGNAIADVLLGTREPGGRLPTTWPDRLTDAPVTAVTPVDGVVVYDEGIYIGYRAWAKMHRTPAFEFGFGLGYTTWKLGQAGIETGKETITVTVAVTNTGDRRGKQVVQIYASRPESSIDRPQLWLVGFAVVRVDAGDTAEVQVDIPHRRFAHWDGRWRVEPGDYQLRVGTSVAQLADPVTVSLG